MKARYGIVFVLVIVLLLSSCQFAGEQTPAQTALDTPSVVMQVMEPSSSEETKPLYDQCATFVLMVEETSYPVDIPYINVIVTATEAWRELTVGLSYRIDRLDNGEPTFVCYGGSEVAAVFTPQDLSTIAQGSIRVDLDALRQHCGIAFTAGVYRISIDDEFVDVTLTED